MNAQPGTYLPGGPIRGWRLLALFLPFFIPLLLPLQIWMNAMVGPVSTGSRLLTVFALLFLGLLVVIFIVGLIRQFPVWSLPAVGTVLFFFSGFVQLGVQAAVFRSIILRAYGGWPEPLPARIWAMLLVQLVYLVIMAAVVVGLVRIVPGFHKHVRQEWTLQSFLLYGLAILPVLGNDEFRGVEGYEIASLSVLAVGAGLYVKVPRRWQRALALIIPAILSPAIMSLGLYQTFPAQPWADPTNPSFRIWEALQPVLYLSPLPVLLMLAALTPRLPWSGGQELTSTPFRNAPAAESE